MRILRLVTFGLACAFLFSGTPAVFSQGSSSPGPWKITSVKVCRTSAGTLVSSFSVIGTFRVYSFFIPRPVWTVNGTVVDAKPVYDKGRLESFQLLDATPLLKSGTRNTVKFSLPDQHASKTFYFDDAKPQAGECWEFF
jgi:hypothetical protein